MLWVYFLPLLFSLISFVFDQIPGSNGAVDRLADSVNEARRGLYSWGGVAMIVLAVGNHVAMGIDWRGRGLQGRLVGTVVVTEREDAV